MLSDTHFRDLEAALEDRSHVTVSAEVLRQLLSAVHVANAAARVERDRWDVQARTHTDCGARDHLRASQWNLARALARYTQPQPQQVNA